MTEEERKKRRQEAVKRWKAKNPDYHKKWATENRDKLRQADKKYYDKHLDRVLAKNKEWRTANPDKVKVHKKKDYETHKEQILVRDKKYREANAEKLAQQKKKYLEANKKSVTARHKAYYEANKERICARQKTFRESHPSKVNALNAKRRAAKMNQTPQWLTPTDYYEMECIYIYCSALNAVGLNYHVDHIIPLQGKTARGLHVPWNLQVLTASENISKGNKIET